ncbi:hypothetical protein OEZ86_000098 [Tetradesmus obliquus]|nr:hypothetical protein OEZ86_000098 [Tetradesmus obliquus]
MRCRCKARLLRGSKSAALTKTAQQHAAKLEGILAVAYEAHTNFQTSFTLAVAAGTQQLQAGAGQQPLETPYSSHSRTAVLQQRSAAPGSCPGTLQQASCSNPGVELAPHFFTSCGEPTACQQQQLAALQAPLQQAVQLSKSIAQAADGEQQIKRNVEAQDASTLVANLEAAAGIPQQIVQQDSSEDLVAAALACMPDYQRAWALLQQAAGASGEACHLLGQLCEQGLGLPAADYDQAAAWYGHGAALQHAASAHALAFALENGLGVTRDLAAALDCERIDRLPGAFVVKMETLDIYDTQKGITSSAGNVSSWNAGTWSMASSSGSNTSSIGGSSSNASSWVPQWAAQQINAAWIYVERVISSTGGAPEEGMPSSSMDSEAQEHLQTWQAGSSAPGQLSWATVLPQAIPQGLRSLQSKVPQLLALQRHDPLDLPVTAQHAYQLTAEAAERGRACSSGGRTSLPGFPSW